MKKYLQLKCLFLLSSLTSIILSNNHLQIDATKQQNLISNIHIGNIEINSQEEIIYTMENIELFNQEEQLRNMLVEQLEQNNLTFERITFNFATVHLRQNAWINNEFISNTRIFTINFTTTSTLLSNTTIASNNFATNIPLTYIITTTNLGLIQRNHPYYIISALQSLNPNITATHTLLEVINITSTSARVIYNSSFHSDSDYFIDVTFEIIRPILSTMNVNTNLGALDFDENYDNQANLIISTFLNINANAFLYNHEYLLYFQTRILNDSTAIIRRRTTHLVPFVREINSSRSYYGFRPPTIEELANPNIENLFSVPLYDEIIVTFSINNSNNSNNRNNICSKNSTNVIYIPSQREKRQTNSNNCNYQNKINASPIEKIIDYLELDFDKYDENNKIFVANNCIFRYIEKWQNYDIFKKFKIIDDGKIVSLKKDSQGKLYGLSNKKDLYLLNLETLEAKKIEKELTLYYNDDKSNKEIIVKDLNSNPWNYVIVKDFNLEKINPSKYKKFKFIDKNHQFKTILDLNDESKIQTGNPISSYDDYDLKQLLTQKKVSFIDGGVDELADGSPIRKVSLQNATIPRWINNHIYAEQKFGLTYYLENNNYHLQVIIKQEISKQYYKYPNSMFLANIGTGIKLYNKEENNIKTKSNDIKINHIEL